MLVARGGVNANPAAGEMKTTAGPLVIGKAALDGGIQTVVLCDRDGVLAQAGRRTVEPVSQKGQPFDRDIRGAINTQNRNLTGQVGIFGVRRKSTALKPTRSRGRHSRHAGVVDHRIRGGLRAVEDVSHVAEVGVGRAGIQHDLDHGIVGLGDQPGVDRRTRLAVAVHREIVLGDQRKSVGRGRDVMRPGTRDVEGNCVYQFGTGVRVADGLGETSGTVRCRGGNGESCRRGNPCEHG